MNKNQLYDTKPKKEKAFLVGVEFHNSNHLLGVNESLEELELLADTAGLIVVGSEQQKLSAPNPATFIGSGKVEDQGVG